MRKRENLWYSSALSPLYTPIELYGVYQTCLLFTKCTPAKGVSYFTTCHITCHNYPLYLRNLLPHLRHAPSIDCSTRCYFCYSVSLSLSLSLCLIKGFSKCDERPHESDTSDRVKQHKHLLNDFLCRPKRVVLFCIYIVYYIVYYTLPYSSCTDFIHNSARSLVHRVFT